MAPVLLVSPARRLAAVAAERHPSHLLAFRSPGPTPALLPLDRVEGRLELVFNDIAEPREGLTPPDAEAVERFLAFALAWPGERPLLVSCHAGVSRSTAAAFVIACAKTAPGREGALAQALRAVAPSATPNPLLVALGDAALGRGGRMRAAVAAVGRGADAFEGETFAWDLATGTAERLSPGPDAGSQAASPPSMAPRAR